tara:strand:- start:26 stop:631 length:606 start_codon:yes stop_codon:yes gene_type:complete
MKIVIDGNIGSGKTTLLKNLNSTYNVITEDIRLWRPWLNLFYKDIRHNSLGFQLRVLLSHLQNKNCDKDDYKEPYILERSPFTSIYVFGKLLEESGDLSKLEYDLCKEYAKTFGWEPDVYIYLCTNPTICHKRIKKRDRDGEEAISLDYLTKVHNKYEEMVSFLKSSKSKNEKSHIYTINACNDDKTVLKEIINILNTIMS